MNTARVKRLAHAFGFLTRLPIGVTTFAPGDLARAAAMFPAVGAFLGATQWGLYAAARALGWQLNHWLFAMLASLFVVLITGALHLDGLADTCDGVGGGRTPEDVRRIMKDHAVGAYGSVAIALALLIRTVCLARLCQQGAWCLMLMAPVCARFGAVVLAYAQPKRSTSAKPIQLGSGEAAAPEGLGALFLEGIGWREVTGAALVSVGWCAVISWLFGTPVMAVALLLQVTAALALLLWLRGVARQRVGRVTGDVLGALIELIEVGTLLVAALALDALLGQHAAAE